VFAWLGRKDPKRELKRALGEYSLPSFPVLVTQILEKLRDPAATAASVAAVVQGDPGLSVRVLTTVNSAAYALPRRIDGLPQAVALLGMGNLESVVLAVAVQATLPHVVCRGFASRRFWLAAARRAATAQALARLLHPATRAESFTAAFLQDMAVPFLALSRGEAYGEVLEAWHQEGGDLAERERAALGLDHAEVATWLCAEWNLPEGLALAIAGHHAPPGSVPPGCPPAVVLVGRLRESEENGGVDELSTAAVEGYGLPPEQVAALLRESFAQAEELAALFA